MINRIKTILKIKGKDTPADVVVEVSDAGKFTKSDFLSVLRVAAVTGLATLLTTLGVNLSEINISDEKFLVFIPIVASGLKAISRWLITSYTAKVTV